MSSQNMAKLSVFSPSVEFEGLNRDEFFPKDSKISLWFSAAIGIEKTKSCAVIGAS